MLAASLKAIAAFVGTFASALGVTLQDRTDLGSMSGSQWLAVIGTALGVAVLTWLVPNYGYAPKQPNA